jgi:hypothetical protein
MLNVEVYSEDVEGGEAKKTHGTFLGDNLPTAHAAFPFPSTPFTVVSQIFPWA